MFASRTAHSMGLWSARVSIATPIKSSTHLASNGIKVFNASAELMHQHFGHLHSEALRQFCSSHTLKDTCTSCILAKTHRKPFSSTLPHSSCILFCVHSDVVGPIQSLTCSGKCYFVTFIDKASRFNTVFLISKKSEVFDCFRQYLASAERYTRQKLCVLKSDRGGEYRSSQFLAFAATHGIILEQGAAKTLQHNGLAERFNRTIMERVRALVIHFNMPSKLWGEAVMATSHILNLSPSSSISQSPHDIWHAASADGGMHSSDEKFLRVLGCEACAHKHGDERRKLDPASTCMVHVGYEPGAKAYRLYDLLSGKICVARDVTFIETVFTFRHQQCASEPTEDSSIEDLWFPSPKNSSTTPSSPHASTPELSLAKSPIRPPSLCPLQFPRFVPKFLSTVLRIYSHTLPKLLAHTILITLRTIRR